MGEGLGVCAKLEGCKARMDAQITGLWLGRSASLVQCLGIWDGAEGVPASCLHNGSVQLHLLLQPCKGTQSLICFSQLASEVGDLTFTTE